MLTQSRSLTATTRDLPPQPPKRIINQQQANDVKPLDVSHDTLMPCQAANNARPPRHLQVTPEALQHFFNIVDTDVDVSLPLCPLPSPPPPP